MNQAIPVDILGQDAEGRYLWLTLNELVSLVDAEDTKPASVVRTLERWCVSGVLEDFAIRLYPDEHEEQIRQLFFARRLNQPPPRDKGMYLVHRDALTHLKAYPKPGRKRKPS